PAEGGKFTMWVTDFGWGQIAAVRAAERARLGIPEAERTHQTLRGAHTLLYTAPQVLSGEPANPPDDVFSLRVLLDQLPSRDPQPGAPIGTAWIEEFEPDGLTPAQSRLLASCLSPNADERPADAVALVALLSEAAAAPTSEPLSRISAERETRPAEPAA